MDDIDNFKDYGWTYVSGKPIAIGKASRGFLIKKADLRLKSNEEYVLCIIPKRNFQRRMVEEL